MKKLVLLIVTVILVKAVQAQIPQTLNYQGIARNASGDSAVASQTTFMS